MSSRCWRIGNSSLDLLSQRLYTQHLAGPPLERPEDVIRLLGAVQSQDYLGAKWSVGQRIRNGTDAAVDRAFSGGRILRTHVLRPTWHFVTPDDIRWILHLTGPRVQALNAYRYRQLELDGRVLVRGHTLFARALEGGKQLTRAELAEALRRGGIVASGPRLAHLVMHAELDGVVCSGALRGKQHTYALLDERAPRARVLARDEALAELAYRFFSGHGPATMAHYVWWSGLKVADAKAGLAMIRNRLTTRAANGRTYWLDARSRSPATKARDIAYLIPEYDEAILGYKDLAIPDLPRAKDMRAWTDVFYRPVIIGGRRAGTWRRTVGGNQVVLETNLFTTLNPAQRRALEAAAERYGEFLGKPVTLAKGWAADAAAAASRSAGGARKQR